VDRSRSSDCQDDDRLFRELRHARAIVHPNVCRVFDVVRSDERWFLSMEYAAGGSLRAAMLEGRPASERIADARAIIAGVAAIHAAGLVHRDLKPENILRMEDGRLVVSDFGLARAADHSTTFSAVAGTPGYLAPEVAMGLPATPGSDVYALGVLLCELLLGGRPTRSVETGGGMSTPPAVPAASVSERQVAALLTQCLDRIPSRRPASAQDLRTRFDRALSGEYRRSRRAIWAVAAMVALAGSGFVFSRMQTAVPPAVEPASELVPRPLKLVGVPRDWESLARLVHATEDSFISSDVLPGGESVRLLLGPKARSRSRVIQLATGEAAESPFPGGVERPAVSPNGRVVAFQSDEHPFPLMLSPRLDGGEPEAYAVGYVPIWFSNGRALLFGTEGNRIAVGTPPARPEYFPEIDSRMIPMGFDASSKGDLVAILYVFHGVSKVGVFDYPSKRLRALWSLPHQLSGLYYASDGALILQVHEGRAGILARLTFDGRLVRLWKLRDGHVWSLRRALKGDAFFSTHRNFQLELPIAGGSPQPVYVHPLRNDAIPDWPGKILFSEDMDDMRSRIMLHSIREGRRRPLSAGPNDGFAIVTPDRERFAYTAGDKSELRICLIDLPTSCRVLARAPAALLSPRLSPDGSKVAYMAYQTSGSHRLAVVSVKGGEPIDLGPVSSGCYPRWGSETRLWTFDRSTGRWLEYDLLTGDPTGNNSPANELTGPLRCPEEPGRSALEVKTVGRGAKVWFVPQQANAWAL
jgi:hypothetical protein